MSAVISTHQLQFVWTTFDPFLFCVHHNDAYPQGTEDMGVDPASLAGRNMGSDFSGREGWSMYHGDRVPGFLRHPHRGFETLTVARRGFIDHSDSMGATARFGHGDAQWMTAGKGIVHSEMFPLVDREEPNPGELFQIWINLPAHDKMVDPHFAMLWGHTIPRHEFTDAAGKQTVVTTVAGELEGTPTPAPPPNSWASKPENEVAVWTIQMKAGAEWTVPPAPKGVNRTLYFFQGTSCRIDDRKVAPMTGVRVVPDVPVKLVMGSTDGEVVMLQGRPIAEPVAHHGPMVMNTREELQQAFYDYRQTGFGGWPWPQSGPVHPREQGRFAIHADGRREEPT